MKSVMEDFADIAARLNQIEREKLAVVMGAPVEEAKSAASDTSVAFDWTNFVAVDCVC
jgi:hypothetical protein